jgi:hypothetical protein
MLHGKRAKNSRFAEMAKASQQEQQTPEEICWLAKV